MDMKTVKINVYKEQLKWLMQHEKADFNECDKSGRPIKVVYISPIGKWGGMIDSDGMVDVPVMEYHNNLSMNDISDELNDLSIIK